LRFDTGRRRAAARALAAIASRTRRLDASTVVALLRYPELEETWFALSQLDQPSTSLRRRVLEQGVHAVDAGQVPEYWVLRALGKTDPTIVPLLFEVASDDGREPTLRAGARAALADLGSAGTKALARLEHNSPRTSATPPDPRQQALEWLDAFERGRASKLLPDPKFSASLHDPDPLVVERALAVFARVPERPELDEAIRSALGQANPGIVATAATTLSRVVRERPALAPSRETVQALKEALLGDHFRNAVPTQIALIDAVGALQVLSIKSALVGLCDSPVASVRAAVGDALVRMRAEPCTDPSTQPPPPPGPSTTSNSRLRLQVGERVLYVELDPDLSAATSERLRQFVDTGGFDGSHVVVDPSGEWVRVGDPEGDSYPNGRTEPLLSTPTGKPFEPGSVALWQYGADAVSLELVVVLEDRPDMDADHTRVGTATGPWAELIGSATVTKAHSEPSASAPSSQ
jgi:hypothetical protein